MYTYESWEKESEAVRSRLNLFNRDDERFWRAYTSNRSFVIPDEKLGRISIPKALLESVGIDKEAVFCGRDFKIEIWAKDSLESTTLSDDEYVALAEKTLGQRR
jgi:MraZ protein